MWRKLAFVGALLALVATIAMNGARTQASNSYDITTLAGKVASVNGTAGLQIRMSAFIQEEAAQTTAADVLSADGATLSAGSGSVQAPDVTVNQDTAAAAQNETSIAVDPNNANRVVGSANDYVSRTWSCMINGTPCSALGDGYSGTYYSNDGGATWCCTATDPQHLGTLIPGVTRLAGGSYDAGGDPAVAFDAQGNVYYSGLGFDRTAAPNTVAVNKGTFDSNGALTWSAPTFIDPTTSPSVFNDKEWITADATANSPFANRVYVTFTRFVFSPANGRYVQSPIYEAYSTDGGKTFSTPQSIVRNVMYDQGSRPVVGPDGTVYVFWDGATRLSTLDSTYMVKSTDGGVSWSVPVQISTLNEINPPADTNFRVNSFPAAAVAPNGDIYTAWSTEESDPYGGHAEAVYSKSTNGGASWSAPAPIFPALDAMTRTPEDYAGTGLTPDTHMVDTFWPGVGISSTGRVYMSAYGADVTAPWQSCAEYDPNGSINCLTPGDYVNNGKLDYYVSDLTTNVSEKVTTQSINTRYMFRGGFIGDYTDIAVGSDNVAHPLWTDTNNTQDVYWFYGTNFNGLPASQQDVVTRAVKF